MKRSLLSVDGVEYPNIYILSVKRSFNILDGENVGRVMSGEMQRDIIGTYYNYSMEISQSYSDPSEYDALYEALSAPENSHEIVLPYGQGTLTFQAYVSNGEDELFSIYESGLNKWDKLTFNFIAMSPQRRPS